MAETKALVQVLQERLCHIIQSDLANRHPTRGIYKLFPVFADTDADIPPHPPHHHQIGPVHAGG